MAKQDKKKKRYNYQMQRANMTHVLILVLVGGYLVYMAWKMIENTRTGNSSMGMTQTVILAAVMGLVALAVFAYAGYVYYISRKKSELTEEEARELDEQMAQADLENYGYVVHSSEDPDEPHLEAGEEDEDDTEEAP